MIGSVSSATSALSIESVLQASTTSASATRAVTGAGDTADISGPGNLFAALKELATENPEKFKTVAADIAAKLKAAASDESTSATAAGGSSPLTDLAAKFDEAAQTGDASVLAPPSGGHHRHGHHGVGAYNSAGQPLGTSAAPPTGSATGVDLKSLFDSITKEVTDALAA